jgi:hypothetical protein
MEGSYAYSFKSGRDVPSTYRQNISSYLSIGTPCSKGVIRHKVHKKIVLLIIIFGVLVTFSITWKTKLKWW